MTPTFQGEVQYRYHADSPKGGQQIVLQLPSRDELGSFIGKEGRRFMAVFVEIGDDEKPAQEQSPAARPRASQPIGANCYWSVLRCAEPVFWEFLNLQFPGGDTVRTAAQAAEVVKFVCGVESRKEFDTNPEGRIAFRRQIKDPWDRYWLARSSR